MITGAFSKPGKQVTSPRSIVVVGGHEVPFQHWTVECTGFDAADTFEVVLPFNVSMEAGDMILSNSASQASATLTDSDIEVQIYRGNPSDPNNYSTSDLEQNMIGFVDTVRIDFDDQGERLTLTGRNLAALLIDTKTTEKYPNQTSSQIATSFASQHGLTPVITPTTTLAGTYYNQDATVMGNETTQWDLLLFLAQQEGFVVRVKGTKLYFGPPDQVTDVTLDPIPMTWGANILSMEIERQPHAARDIEVQVISYDRNHKHRIIEKAKSTTQYTQRLSNQMARQNYVETYAIPGLTREQAQAKAKSILAELSSQQYVGTLKTNGDYGFTVDRRITLYGVGQVLSQTYYINRVTETFDMENNGWDVEIAFLNQFLLPGGNA